MLTCSGWRLLCSDRGEMLNPCFFDDGFKSLGIEDGDIGKDFSVDFDAILFEAGDEGAVIFAECADGGADACDPEGTEGAFFLTAISVGEDEAVDDLLFCLTEAGTTAAESAGEFQPFVVSLTTFCTSFSSCHDSAFDSGHRTEERCSLWTRRCRNFTVARRDPVIRLTSRRQCVLLMRRAGSV